MKRKSLLQSTKKTFCFTDREFYEKKVLRYKLKALNDMKEKCNVCPHTRLSLLTSLSLNQIYVRREVWQCKRNCTKASGRSPDRSGRSPDASPHIKEMRGLFVGEKKNVLEIVQQIKDAICKKQLIESSTSVIVSISGGQDSIFLLFSLSFLQSKITFTFKMLWCNHFWQTDSFYTTLHLTMCALNFRRSLIAFIPLFVFDSNLLTSYIQIEDLRLRTNTLVYKSKGFVRHHLLTSLSLNRRFVRREVSYTSLLTDPIASQYSHDRSWLRPEAKQNFAYVDRKSSFSNCIPKMIKSPICIVHHQRIELASKFAVVRMTSETIARHWRHLTTERSCTFYTLDKAIYGHTLSDRVETIMFNLIRGTGNMKSLFWKRKFSTFFYNRFFLSFQYLLHNTHFNSFKI